MNTNDRKNEIHLETNKNGAEERHKECKQKKTKPQSNNKNDNSNDDDDDIERIINNKVKRITKFCNNHNEII